MRFLVRSPWPFCLPQHCKLRARPKARSRKNPSSGRRRMGTSRSQPPALVTIRNEAGRAATSHPPASSPAMGSDIPHRHDIHAHAPLIDILSFKHASPPYIPANGGWFQPRVCCCLSSESLCLWSTTVHTSVPTRQVTRLRESEREGRAGFASPSRHHVSAARPCHHP